MNGFSKFLCTIGILAAVGGGITLGIGCAQGGQFNRLIVNYSSTTVDYATTKDEYEAMSVGTAVDVSLISGNVFLFNSEDDTLTITYTYRIDEEAIRFPQAGSNFTIKEYSRFQDLFSFNLMWERDSEVKIYLPSWYNDPVFVNLINGDIISKTSEFNGDITCKLVNGKIDFTGLSSTQNMNLSTTNGNINVDASSFVHPGENLKYCLSTINGYIGVKLNSSAVYHHDLNKTNGKITTEGDSDGDGMLIEGSTVNGNIEVIK